MQPLTRVLVIGADSGDPGLIEHWAEQGDLPNLKALRARGAFARIQNPPGCDGGSAWPCFHSGLYPGCQPQFDGVRYFDRQDYAFKYYSPAMAGPTLVEELSRSGKRCFVMDAPYAHLVKDIDGISIVDWGSHGSVSGGGTLAFATSPASVADEIVTLVGSDPVGGLTCDDHLPETIDDYREFLHLHLDRIRKKTRLIRHFLAKGKWDYFEAVFCELHCMGHHMWHINDKRHPRYRADFEAALGEPLRDCFKAIDHALGEILAMLDDRTLVIFYASHGIGPQYTGTGLLDRLLQNIERGKKAGGGGYTLKGRLRALWRSIPPDIRESVMPVKKHFSGALVHDALLPDRERRKFFEVYLTNGAGGVRLNLKGREAQGIVEPAAYHTVLDQITAALSELVNAESGEPVVAEILRMHEIYSGPYIDALPDLAVVWNRSHPIRLVRSERLGTLAQEYADARTGDHTPDGLFFAAGENVRPGGLNHAVRPVDFAPTLRALLDLPAAPSDGEPISALNSARPSLAYSRA